MADIEKSTSMKDRPVEEWVGRHAATFNLVRSWVTPNYLKTVGDMIMFWFTDENFYRVQHPLILLNSLTGVFRESEVYPEYYQAVRVAVCRCETVYELAFIRGGADVYGKEIDLTARLLHMAEPGEILMNRAFYERLREHYEVEEFEEEYKSFKRIQGPWSSAVKGWSDPVDIFKLPKPKSDQQQL